MQNEPDDEDATVCASRAMDDVKSNELVATIVVM